MAAVDPDYALALHLQSVFDSENEPNSTQNGVNKIEPPKHSNVSIVDSSWELVDPTPDIFAMFIQFNKTYFWGKLDCVEIKWSPRMTLCAGLCRYQSRGLCSISLSLPLLKLRPRKDLVETMLHEMIHAYLFVTHNNKDRDGHGPEFLSHMDRLNKATGTKITVYHSFHDEVKSYRTHWWKCNGPCQSRHPFYGMVKRSMNRAPGPYDIWWAEHQASCGGTYTKIKEPEGFSAKKKKTKKDELKSPYKSGQPEPKRVKLVDVVPFSGKGQVLGGTSQRPSPKKERIDDYFNVSGSSSSSKDNDVIVIEDDSPAKKPSTSGHGGGKLEPRQLFSQVSIDKYFTKKS